MYIKCFIFWNWCLLGFLLGQCSRFQVRAGLGVDSGWTRASLRLHNSRLSFTFRCYKVGMLKALIPHSEAGGTTEAFHTGRWCSWLSGMSSLLPLPPAFPPSLHNLSLPCQKKEREKKKHNYLNYSDSFIRSGFSEQARNSVRSVPGSDGEETWSLCGELPWSLDFPFFFI